MTRHGRSIPRVWSRVGTDLPHDAQVAGAAEGRDDVLALFSSLRQHQSGDRRSPHKPLLALLALESLVRRQSTELRWSEAEDRLAALVAEFGPASRTGRAQSAAYPFTRLRSDGMWRLDREVPMDLVGPLHEHDVAGSFTPEVEAALTADPQLVREVARRLVTAQFPETIVPDVLNAVGLDVQDVLGATGGVDQEVRERRRRDPAWRTEIVQAWDRQCAFCGFDGSLVGYVVAVDAAHVRWFAFDGPDALDNGLALCVLHHKLFDLGVLGLGVDLAVRVSSKFTSRTDAGRRIYSLHGRSLMPRRGTVTPAEEHLDWHDREVFKHPALAG